MDRLGDRALRLAALAPKTRTALLDLLLPPYADNPIDIGGRRDENAEGVVGCCVEVLASDPDVAALLVVLTTTPAYEARTCEIGAAAMATGKPAVVVVTPGSAADGPRRALRETGCPYYETLDEAVRVLAHFVEAGRAPAASAAPPSRPSALPAPGALRGLAPAGQLTEVEAKALLRAYGIAVPRERPVSTVAEGVAAAAEIGYPVALKGVARGVIHKSDLGLVRLGLADADAVRRAWGEVAGAVSGHGVLDGCLVAEMVRGEAELIVGTKRDEQFGPVVLVGAGGTLVEVLRDVRMALAPVTPDRALELLRALRIWPVLAGLRGRPALDVAAAAEAISRVSWLAADLADRLAELDVNPLIVRAGHGGAIAVDARATVEGGGV